MRSIVLSRKKKKPLDNPLVIWYNTHTKEKASAAVPQPDPSGNNNRIRSFLLTRAPSLGIIHT